MAASIEALTRAARSAPKDANRWLRLGSALRSQSRPAEAADALLRAVKLRPSWAAASYELGMALAEQQQFAAAAQCLERAVSAEPKHFEYQRQLALTWVKAGDPQRAAVHYQQAMLLDEQSLDVVLELAAVANVLGRQDAALALLQRATRIAPDHAGVRNDLGNALFPLGRWDEAIAVYREGLALSPESVDLHVNLGAALRNVGQVELALASYREALRLDPSNSEAHSALLFTQSYAPGASSLDLLAEARAFGARHTEPLRHERPAHANARAPERKLRIGYLSSDFRTHVSGHYLPPLFAEHDRAAFDICGYASVFPPDAWTERYARQVTLFRNLWGVDDAAAARLIQEDEIDILVDLTMHCGGRQLVLARKPAPVQVCWLAYVGTTGNDAIDYRITDPYLDPPERSASPYTERLARLPRSFWCYDPQDDGLEVTPLPARERGQLTLGCLGSFCKINPVTLELWARVLGTLPDARLLLFAPPGGARQRVLSRLGEAGVESRVVQFVDHVPRREYLRLYQQVDLCLDALPYNSLTNTLDAAWMGVPTLTLVGDTVVGRAGSSVAMNLGLPQLVTHTSEQFVERARELARDLDALAELRTGLRARLQRSPLMDAKGFAADLEALYRQLWREWCAS